MSRQGEARLRKGLRSRAKNRSKGQPFPATEKRRKSGEGASNKKKREKAGSAAKESDAAQRDVKNRREYSKNGQSEEKRGESKERVV